MLNEARSSACEIVAWRFLARLSDADAVRYCLYEIPDARAHRRAHRERDSGDEEQAPGELSPLLTARVNANPDGTDSKAFRYRPGTSASRRSLLLDSVSCVTDTFGAEDVAPITGDSDPTVAFRTLNALEIAAIAGAKRFLGRNVVQRIVTGIWHGDVIFWDSLSVHATKRPRFYDPDTADPYSRLRVPKYLKSFESIFFLIFLYLYYAVLIQRVEHTITATEVVLWTWIAAFCYDEFSEWLDAGSIFYVTDIWNVCDVIMMLLALAFSVLSMRAVVLACQMDWTNSYRNHRRHPPKRLYQRPCF